MFRIENSSCSSYQVNTTNINTQIDQITAKICQIEQTTRIFNVEDIKSDIASLSESLRQTISKIPDIDIKKISEIDQCKSDIASLSESLKQTMSKIPDIDIRKISEIDQCKSDIASLSESLRQTISKIPDIDIRKISEIDQCKSDIISIYEALKQTMASIPNVDLKTITEMETDIASLTQSIERISEIDQCKSDIASLSESLNQIISKIPNINRKKISKFETDIAALIQQTLDNKMDISTILESLEQTSKRIPNNFDFRKISEIDQCKSDIASIYEALKQTMANTPTEVKKIIEIETDIASLMQSIERISEIDQCKSDIASISESIRLNFSHDVKAPLNRQDLTQDISDLKTRIRFLEKHSAPNGSQQSLKFSLNSNGVFVHDLKKTLFFSPGLILPQKIFVYSLYITTIIKEQAKHNYKFELIAIKNGIPPTPLHEFEKEAFNEFVMEEFDPPIEIGATTKILVSCNKKIEGMAVLTITY